MVEQTITSKPNTYATIVNKSSYDPRPLFDTQSLYNAVKDAKVHFDVIGSRMEAGGGTLGASYVLSPPAAGDSVYVEGQHRKDPSYIYLWSHEFGTKKPSWKFGIKEWGTFTVPKRSFLKRGLTKGYRKAYAILYGAIYKSLQVKYAPTEFKYTKFKRPTLNMEREFRFHEWDMIMAVAPPSSAYAILGGGADAISFLKGDFQIPNVEAFLASMAKGRAGATKKVWRRGFRRRLWR